MMRRLPRYLVPARIAANSTENVHKSNSYSKDRRKSRTLPSRLAIAVLSLAFVPLIFLELAGTPVYPNFVVDNNYKSLSHAAVENNGKSLSKAAFENNGKPLFVLHVGPYKTGTTLVQWFAGKMTDVMEKDNLYYVGHRSSQQLHHLHDFCVAPSFKDEDLCTSRWDEFERTLEEHYDQGHNVMASEELLTSFNDEEAEQYLWNRLVPLQQKWNVRIIYTHRRFFEWLPSRYSQKYNPNHPVRNKRTENWPDKGGRITESFPEFFENQLLPNRLPKFCPLERKKRWEAHFSNVQVFNMHQDGDYLKNFWSQMVPEAIQVCEFLKSQPSLEMAKNMSPKNVIHFDMLAVEAYKNDWVKNKLARKAVSRAAEAFSNQLNYTTLTDFHLRCLSETQAETLLNISLSIEREMVPSFFSSTLGEAKLRSEFAEAVKKKRFCSVDCLKQLKDERWKNFFETLIVR